MKKEEDTLEIYRLAVSNDEVEYEAAQSVTEYLIQRSSEYANRLGRRNLRVKESSYIIDSLSGDHLFVYFCERDFR